MARTAILRVRFSPEDLERLKAEALGQPWSKHLRQLMTEARQARKLGGLQHLLDQLREHELRHDQCVLDMNALRTEIDQLRSAAAHKNLRPTPMAGRLGLAPIHGATKRRTRRLKVRLQPTDAMWVLTVTPDNRTSPIRLTDPFPSEERGERLNRLWREWTDLARTLEGDLFREQRDEWVVSVPREHLKRWPKQWGAAPR